MRMRVQSKGQKLPLVASMLVNCKIKSIPGMKPPIDQGQRELSQSQNRSRVQAYFDLVGLISSYPPTIAHLPYLPTLCVLERGGSHRSSAEATILIAIWLICFDSVCMRCVPCLISGLLWTPLATQVWPRPLHY